MWNEHSVCEREIESLKEEVEYYKTLFHNEHEARQRNIDELHDRRVKELFELADMLDKEHQNFLKLLRTQASIVDVIELINQKVGKE